MPVSLFFQGSRIRNPWQKTDGEIIFLPVFMQIYPAALKRFGGKSHHVVNIGRIGQQHDQPVNTQGIARGRWHV